MSSPVLHREFAVLPGAGAFDDAHDPMPIRGGGKIGVILKYTEDGSATDGYPGYRIMWRVKLNDVETWICDTVRLAAVTPDETFAPLAEYFARPECTALTGASAGFAGGTIDVFPGANAVRIEPAEIGDPDNPGELAIWLGRIL